MTQNISMPCCEHLIPIQLNCMKCNRLHPDKRVEQLTNDIERIVGRLAELEKAFSVLAYQINDLPSIITDAQAARQLFAKKVHDLKSVDKKRDDVINALCQKVEKIDYKIKLFENTRWKTTEDSCHPSLLSKLVEKL